MNNMTDGDRGFNDLPMFKSDPVRQRDVKELVRTTEAYARNSDPETSHDAATHVREELPNLESVVLKAFCRAGENGLTGDELAEATGIFRHTCCPRIAPLRRKGFIVDSGERRPGSTGRNQVVWRVADAI